MSASVLGGEEAFRQAELRDQLRTAGLPILTHRGQDLQRAWEELDNETERSRLLRAGREAAARRAAGCPR